MTKRTKILITILGVIGIIVIGLLLYFFVFRQPLEIPEEAALTPEERARLTLTEEEIQRGTTLQEKISDIEAQRRLALERGEEITPVEVDVAYVKPIIEQEVMEPTLSPDRQSILYYDPNEGEFFVADLDGNNQRSVTSQALSNVWDVDWSKNKDKAIVVFSENEGKDKQYMYLDLRTQTTNLYDDKFQAVTLSPDDNKIAYLFNDEENGITNISVANPDGSEFESLFSFPDPSVDINWFDNDYMELKTQSSAFTEGKVVIADTEGETMRVVVGEKYAVDTLESPDSSKIIYTESDLKNPREVTLMVKDIQGFLEPKYLGVNTLVDKCAWASDNVTVYCGVPDFHIPKYVMPNDYYNGKFITTDSFYRINTETQETEMIARSDSFEDLYDVYSPYMSSDGKVFYFTSRTDNQLHALTIPD